MSVPSNITNWQPMMPIDQGIYEESTTQKARLGTEITVGDRCFKYAAAGAALDAGDIVSTPVNTLSVGQTAAAAAAVGDTEVTVYIANSADANAFADGYLIAQDSAGLGYAYKVKSHAAIGDTSTGTVTLYDGIAVALTTVSVLTLVPNKYDAVTDQVTATSPIVGVAPVAVTSGNYFWAQVKGPSAVLVNTTVSYGSLLIPGTDGGATVAAASANAQFIGRALAAGTTGDTAPVLLQVDQGQ